MVSPAASHKVPEAGLRDRWATLPPQTCPRGNQRPATEFLTSLLRPKILDRTHKSAEGEVVRVRRESVRRERV